MLDQVLSFGEGPVTVARVREVLGLIADDIYGEMLRLVTERDPPAVFALVDRLMEAGADLGEFVSGAGETLRAVLLAGLGGEPAGLTEGLQELVRRYAPRLAPPDVVRLLTVLSEAEGQIRSSGNTRLAVEVLLLRWAMMGRTVELGEVIEALKDVGPADRRTGGLNPPGGSVLRDVVPSSSTSPAVRPSDRPPEQGPLTLDRLRALWPQVVADARAQNQMLGALLVATEVASVDETTVTIHLLEDNPVHAEGLERQRDALARLVGRYVIGPVRVAFAMAGGAAQRARPVRLTEDAARAERLARLRATDPGLNVAADALDLELLE